MVNYIRSLFASGSKLAQGPAAEAEKCRDLRPRRIALRVERLEERISPSSMAFIHHKPALS
jgi:hypothetical protein